MEFGNSEVIRIPEKKEKKISDEQLGQVLAAVGNHEAKAITLLAMSDGLTYNTGDLIRKVRQLQGKNQGWNLDFKSPREYCQFSFEPVGLVENQPQLTGYDYQITDEGMNCIPLLGHLLSFSLKYTRDEHGLQILDESGKPYEVSLIQLLGVNARDMASRGKVPLSRIEILRKLLRATKPLPVKDVSQTSLGHFSSIVEEWSASGIVNYKGFYDTGGNEVAYRKSERRDVSPSQLFNLKNLSSAVTTAIDTFPMDSIITPIEVVNKLKESGFSNKMREDVLREVVRKMLLKYSDQGLLVAEFERSRRSAIWLSDIQREMASELVLIVDKYQDQDPSFLADGIIKADSLLKDPQKIAKLMKKGKEKSSYGSKLNSERVEQEIIKLLPATGRLSQAQIEGVLEDIFSRSLSSHYMSDTLQAMRHKGLIQRTDDGFWILV